MAGKREGFWQRLRFWMAEHWKLVGAVVLGSIAFFVGLAICFSPAGPAVLAALAVIKGLAFLTATSSVWAPVVVGALFAAGALAAALVFDTMVVVSNWMDRKITPAPDDGEGFEPYGEDDQLTSGSSSTMGALGLGNGSRPVAPPPDDGSQYRPLHSSASSSSSSSTSHKHRHRGGTISL